MAFARATGFACPVNFGGDSAIKMNDKSVTIFRSKAEQVAHSLLARIVDGRLKPGATFATESELLAQFNVSRPTPLRASPSTIHEPTPPTPTTATCACRRLRPEVLGPLPFRGV